MIDLAGHEATVERDLGGCPVVHFDPSPAREVGSYWPPGRRAARTRLAVFCNTQAQGYGCSPVTTRCA